MPNEVPSLSQLSLTAAYKPKLNKALKHSQAIGMTIAIEHFDIKESILDENLMFPKHIHELALVALKDSYQTLVLQPFEQQLKQQHTQQLDDSSEDLSSELSTKLTLKELEAFKNLYWLARAHDLQAIVSFIETEKKDCSWLFFPETRNIVISETAALGDQENVDKLLSLAINPSDRMTMLTSVIDGACKGGQIAILHKLFEETCQTEVDKTHCQNYLTEGVSNLLSKACARGHFESVEFILKRIPETEHKKIVSEFYEGFRYHALSEAFQSGNLQVVDRLLKPFSQVEIDRIFLPTLEETKNLPLPFRYNDVLSYNSFEINQHILSKVVSPECRQKIVTSESFVYFNQRFKKDCENMKGPSSVAKSRLVHSQFFSEASSSQTENKAIETRLQDSLFFSQFSEQVVDKTEKDKKDKKRSQASRITKY